MNFVLRLDSIGSAVTSLSDAAFFTPAGTLSSLGLPPYCPLSRSDFERAIFSLETKHWPSGPSERNKQDSFCTLCFH